MNVREGGLTPDIPVGSFEGVLIPVYVAAKAARLHARLACPRLRADHVSELKVPLNAISIEQMCAECARWGRWAPPGSALGMYLEVFSGCGLPDQLASYTGPDLDDFVTDKEIADAAALLRSGEYPSTEAIGDVGDESDEDEWDAFRTARELRDSRIVPQWCSAVESLMDAAATVVRYPWLGPWAGKDLDLKSKHAEVLRQQAAQLLNPGALVAASGAHRMPMPELPDDDPAFAVIGSSSDIQGALQSLWHEWHLRVSHGWLIPHEYDFLTRELAERMGNKRKGRDELHERARQMLNTWADAAVTAAGSEYKVDQLVMVSIRLANGDRDGNRTLLSKQLTKWELGVLIIFMVAADWATRTFLLKVPLAIAERMLAGDSALSSAPCTGDPSDESAHEGLLARSKDARLAEAGHSAFLPGILDDTPVSQRRAVTLNEVSALRRALDERRQLFIVCSVSGGVEVLPLAVVEERCKTGWSGILVAEAGDLPSSLFAPQLSVQMTATADEENDDVSASVWEDRHLPSEHAEFGEHLGGAAGARKLRWMHHRRDDIRLLEQNFRIFTLARGVHDLRTLDYARDSGVPAVPHNVWLALLLVGEHLDLRPFLPRVAENVWNSGLGLPLSLLADLQIYTTNADPRIAGKGHSPFCQHAREGRVRHDDFLLTLEEVMRRSDLDWCSNCGGYALRRLCDEQISYYRAAHWLLDIDQALTRELDGQYGSQQVDLSATNAALDEISQWLRGNHQRWQDGDTWKVRDVLRELKSKADRLAQYRRDGWPESGSVVHLKPRRKG
jgi:hypothetical protein